MNRIVTSGRLVRNVSPILYRSMSILYDDKQGLMFRIPIERGTEYARIHYELTNGVYNLLHTEVPEIYRGLGHGKAVAKAVFDYVHSNGGKLRLSCEFLKKYYDDHAATYLGLVID